MNLTKIIALLIISTLIIAGLITLVVFQSRKSSLDKSVEKKKEVVSKTYKKDVKIDVITPGQDKLAMPTSSLATLSGSITQSVDNQRQMIDEEIIPTINTYTKTTPISPTKTNQMTKGGVTTLPRAGVISVPSVITIIVALSFIISSFIL